MGNFQGKMGQKWESALWQRIQNQITSPSHGKEHLKRTRGFATRLQDIYGGDPEVIRAAVILHDLARVNTQLAGRESALESAELARDVLVEVGFPEEKVGSVCQAIGEHDQPDISPQSLEGKILKDADFLAGFGAWGILRAALWTGEKGQGMEKLKERLKGKMTARIDGLEFPESRRLAVREWSFVRFFLALLEGSPLLPTDELPGKYVVLEGISGTGKQAQAKRLVKRLKKEKREAILVSEPTTRLRHTLAEWRKDIDDPTVELFLFIADRRNIIETQVLPALRGGKIVVSVRSFISTMVYESTEEYDPIYIAFLHQFVPSPDLIILLDVPAEVAYERIVRRSQATGKRISKYEDLSSLKRYRQRYRRILSLRDFPQGNEVDGTKDEEQVAKDIRQFITKAGIV